MTNVSQPVTEIAPKKRVWCDVDGVLLLDKPGGMTSNDALQKARRLFSAAKGGHTGTLDPMATGLLPLCFGEATKFSSDLLSADKTYEATVHLGETRDTGDAEGQVMSTAPVVSSLKDLDAVLSSLTGWIDQIPPMYSALKQGGRPLYALAREGITVARAPRRVQIVEINRLTDFLPAPTGEGRQVRLRITCSKGTYIRVLAEDIGMALGCGAHLAALRRTRVGALALAGSVTLAELEGMNEGARGDVLKPLDSLLSELPPVQLLEAEHIRFAHGNPVLAGIPSTLYRVYGTSGALLGVGETDAAGALWPKRLIRQQ